MKTTLRPPFPLCRKAKSLILLVLLSTPSRGAETEESGQIRPPEGVPFRDVITTEKLGEAFRQVRLEDPAAKFEPATSEDPSNAARPKDIVKESDILCFNGQGTLLPKGSIIHVPERLKDRVGWKENAELVPWSRFHQNNHGWIATMEIDFEQAKGTAPLEEERSTLLGKSTKLVIATFKKGPITMLPPKASDTEAEGGAESPKSVAPNNGTKPARFNLKR